MTRQRTEFDKLQAVLDCLEEATLEDSYEKLREDIEANGTSSDKVIADMRKHIRASVDRFRRKTLEAAKQGYRKATDHAASVSKAIPKDPTKARKLLDKIVEQSTELSRPLTIAAREGKILSDEDVKTLLQDLIDLGMQIDDQEK